MFSPISDDELGGLIQSGRTTRFRAGSQVLSPGMPAECFYVILTGKVKLYQLSPKGDEQILHLYGPGATFGEAAMWSGGEYPAHAEALTETTLLAIARSALSNAITRRPELALEMMAGMASKLREFNALIEQLSLREVPARLARALLTMAEETGSDTVQLSQSKRELAAQLGTVAETLSRAFARLRKAGLIEVDGARITLLDRDGLTDLAES
jgi:CRP/FNR family transcriptional regulator